MRTACLIVATVLLPVALRSQASAAQVPSYRGFRTGDSYRDFARRARAFQVVTTLPFVCSTARHTAQIMECRAAIRDSSDGAAFRLTAHFVEGRAGFVWFGDSGEVALVERMQRELRDALGAPTRVTRGTWEWGTPRRFTRLNWRARAEARWVSVTLTDLDVLDGVAAYLTPAPEP